MSVLKGHPNVLRLLDVVKNPAVNTYTLVSEYFPHEDFDKYRLNFTPALLKSYMRELLSTLDFIHSKGIIHRDVKPHNVLFDPSTQKLKIIDLGLAEFYHPEKGMSPRVASRFFKAPELLMDMEFYNYSIDIWSAGIIFASIVS